MNVQQQQQHRATVTTKLSIQNSFCPFSAALIDFYHFHFAQNGTFKSLHGVAVEREASLQLHADDESSSASNREISMNEKPLW